MGKSGLEGGDEMFILEYEDRNICLREGGRERESGK